MAAFADAFALELGPERVGGVLDQRHAVLLRDGANLVELQHAAGEMDRDDRLGARSDRGFDRVGRDHQRVAVAVHEDRLRAVERNDVRKRDPGHGGRDDLVAGFQAQGAEQHLHHGRFGGQRDGVLRPDIGAERLLEFGVFRSGGDPAGTQHVGNFGNLPLLNRRPGKRQKSIAHES